MAAARKVGGVFTPGALHKDQRWSERRGTTTPPQVPRGWRGIGQKPKMGKAPAECERKHWKAARGESEQAKRRRQGGRRASETPPAKTDNRERGGGNDRPRAACTGTHRGVQQCSRWEQKTRLGERGGEDRGGGSERQPASRQAMWQQKGPPGGRRRTPGSENTTRQCWYGTRCRLPYCPFAHPSDKGRSELEGKDRRGGSERQPASRQNMWRQEGRQEREGPLGEQRRTPGREKTTRQCWHGTRCRLPHCPFVHPPVEGTQRWRRIIPPTTPGTHGAEGRPWTSGIPRGGPQDARAAVSAHPMVRHLQREAPASTLGNGSRSTGAQVVGHQAWHQVERNRFRQQPRRSEHPQDAETAEARPSIGRRAPGQPGTRRAEDYPPTKGRPEARASHLQAAERQATVQYALNTHAHGSGACGGVRSAAVAEHCELQRQRLRPEGLRGLHSGPAPPTPLCFCLCLASPRRHAAMQPLETE